MKSALILTSILASISLFAAPIKSGIGARESMGGNGKEKLPYDSVVEYIQTQGKQWIDTEYAPNSVMPVFELVGMCPYNTSFYMGMRNSIDAFWIGVRNLNNSYGSLFCRINSNTSEGKNSSYYYATNFFVRSTGTSLISNNLTIPIPDVDLSRNTQNLLIFSNGDSNSSRGVKVKSFQMWEDNILVRDMIPVRFLNSSGLDEGAMYDRVSGKLLKNQGTGTFVVGPDVVEE